MSAISNTPRRPSTAQSTFSTTRMPYEAGEALLWERQNHRVHAHLSMQMKELQAQHGTYDTRIQATESIAEAAEAAVHKVKQMETKIAAIEADERDRPFDAWAKEAIGQLQVFVDGTKGFRQKLNGLDMKVERLGEDIEGLKDESGLLKSVVKRLEVLEGERRTEGRQARESERKVVRLRATDYQQEDEPVEVHEKSYDEVGADDNPLAVFYGIDTQSPSKNHGRKSKDTFHEDNPVRTLNESPQQHPALITNLQPSDQDPVQPEEGSFKLPEAASQIEYGWENTQQFKDMQEELVALRAMCQTQESKRSNETADTTQRPQETIIVPKGNNVEFSDATTETEAEYNDVNRNKPRMVATRDSVDALSSDILLPSSPPKRTDTQSARRNLMKRQSIRDPRVPSVNKNNQPERLAPDTRTGPCQSSRPSLLVKLPVETRAGNNRASAKRKRIDDTPTQRVIRSKLTDDRIAARKPIATTAKENQANEEEAFVEPTPLAFSDDGPAPPSPAHKACGKQKPAVNRPVQRTASQASSSRSEHNTPPVAKPAVLVAEVVKARKAISKSNPAPKGSIQQQIPAQATPSRSKASTAVKREAKGPRQPAGACKSCRMRHQKCDRIHPACGRCAKSGDACEYFLASGSTAPPSVPNVVPATIPKKKRALLPMKKAANKATCKHNSRGTSATVSPETPREKSPAKRPVPASLSKRPAVAAAPTAASSRAPRARNTQNPKKSPNKQK